MNLAGGAGSPSPRSYGVAIARDTTAQNRKLAGGLSPFGVPGRAASTMAECAFGWKDIPYVMLGMVWPEVITRAGVPRWRPVHFEIFHDGRPLPPDRDEYKARWPQERPIGHRLIGGWSRYGACCGAPFAGDRNASWSCCGVRRGYCARRIFGAMRTPANGQPVPGLARFFLVWKCDAD